MDLSKTFVFEDFIVSFSHPPVTAFLQIFFGNPKSTFFSEIFRLLFINCIELKLWHRKVFLRKVYKLDNTKRKRTANFPEKY